MSDWQYLTLFFVVLLAVWPLVALWILALTLVGIVVLSLYKLLQGFVRDELEVYYINRRAEDVVQEARERVMRASA